MKSTVIAEDTERTIDDRIGREMGGIDWQTNGQSERKRIDRQTDRQINRKKEWMKKERKEKLYSR